MDRRQCSAAGLVGFVQLKSADPREYAKLRVFVHQPEWARYGNWGDHTAALSPAFAEHLIAPLLRSDEVLKPKHSTAPSCPGCVTICWDLPLN